MLAFTFLIFYAGTSYIEVGLFLHFIITLLIIKGESVSDADDRRE